MNQAESPSLGGVPPSRKNHRNAPTVPPLAFKTPSASKRPNVVKKAAKLLSATKNSLSEVQAHKKLFGIKKSKATELSAINPSESSSTKSSTEYAIVSPSPPIPSLITMLPESIGLHVFSYLDAKSLSLCASICKSWYPLANHATLWVKLCELNGWIGSANFHRPNSSAVGPQSSINWKSIYASKRKNQHRWKSGNVEAVEIFDRSLVKLSPSRNCGRNEEMHETASAPSVDSNSAPSQHSTECFAHAQSIYCLTMNSDRIVTGGQDGAVKVWSVIDSSEPELIMNLTKSEKSMILSIDSYDNKIVAGLSCGSIVIWNSFTGSVLFDLPFEHSDGISAILIDKRSKLQPQVGSRGIRCARFLMTASFDGSCRIYSMIESDNALAHVPSSKSTRISVASDKIMCKLNFVIPYQSMGLFCGCFVDTNCHPNEMTLAISGPQQNISLWSKVKSKQLSGHHDTVTSLVCLERYLFSASMDKTVRLWDLDSDDCIFTGHHDLWVKSISMHHLGPHLRELYAISGDFGGTIKVWKLSSTNVMEFAFQIKCNDLSAIMALDFDVDRIVAGLKNGKCMSFEFNA